MDVLLYTMELGASEQNIAKQAVRMGQPIPERIANAPKLQLGLNFYLQAFFDLDSEREIGQVAGRIPWSAIVQYGKHFNLTDDEIEVLIQHIKALDIAYLEKCNG